MPRLVIRALLVLWLAVHRAALGAERAPARERFKVVIAPLICRRTCVKGQCHDTCEQGNNTTLIGVNGQSADTLTGPGFRVVVCPHACMNGGVCSSRSHCLCPPGFTGRLCQFPLRQMPEAQAAQGNKQPIYTLQVGPDGQSPGEQAAVGRKQLAQTHSVFTLPLAQGTGQHSPEVQFNVRVHHTADTSVVIHPLDQTDTKPLQKTTLRLVPQTHKPRGRCFQETTPKQAVSVQ
ncbi:latent-transforming growth factor beta-binding protein 3-like isoform X6 [Arapaima gigas]